MLKKFIEKLLSEVVPIPSGSLEETNDVALNARDYYSTIIIRYILTKFYPILSYLFYPIYPILKILSQVITS
jgi:hypothetical protein